MEDKYRFVNLGVYPETRARLNAYKAKIEAERRASVTTDEIINELLDGMRLFSKLVETKETSR